MKQVHVWAGLTAHVSVPAATPEGRCPRAGASAGTRGPRGAAVPSPEPAAPPPGGGLWLFVNFRWRRLGWFLPSGPAWGYLSLLDADFDRVPPNKHLAEAVNYTVRLQGARCLLWDTRRRGPESFSPQPGAAPGKVNCR